MERIQGIVVVSGPSGVGKSTVVDKVLERVSGLERSISVTTRKLRGKEEEGVHYHFKSKTEFEEMKEAGDLIEWAEIYDEFYGTSAPDVERQLASGNNILLEIDVQGAMIVREIWPDALLVFILPPSMEELERRLRERRTESEEDLKKRLEKAEWEIGFAGRYDFQVVNDGLEECVSETAGIIVQRIEEQGWTGGRRL